MQLKNSISVVTIIADAPFSCSSSESVVYADFDSIKWKTLEEIAGMMSTTIVATVPIEQRSVRERQFVKIDGNLAFAGIDIVVEIDGPHAEVKQTIRDNCLAALRHISVNDQETDDLFDAADLSVSGESNQVVMSLANNFLSALGGKSISTPATIYVGESRVCVKGRYAVRPEIKARAPVEHRDEVIIDGLSFSDKKSTFLLANERGRIELLFDEAKFFGTLHSWLLTRESREISWARRPLADKRSVDVLLGISA